MNYKLLSVSKSNKLNEINIGDYIQALASSQYYPRIDGFLDRDTDLKSYDGEPCKIIMNGWYMHNPENWPPSEKINPLFVAFHLNVLAKKGLTSEESISYLKAHEPIGCRDVGTMNILQEKGINAYFSGCMTLTLGKKYYSRNKDEKTYIVDPIVEEMDCRDYFMSICHFFKYPKDIINLLMNHGLKIHIGKNKLKRFFKTSLFHKIYSDFFSRDLVMNSIYICHQNKEYIYNFENDNERLNEAERLVKLYARAKMVITSRIHCALPCLGLETPVLYLKRQHDTKANSCRYDGLSDLFNIIIVGNKGLHSTFVPNLSDGKIPVNKESWRNYAISLDKSCTSFISE